MSSRRPTLDRPAEPSPANRRLRVVGIVVLLVAAVAGLAMLTLWWLLGDDAGANDPVAATAAAIDLLQGD